MLKFLWGLALIVFSDNAKALSLDLSLYQGLVQQPGSNYFLYMYGAESMIGVWDQRINIGGGYWQRPRFKRSGFAEQDDLRYGLINFEAFPKSHWSLRAGFGYAKLIGFIENQTALKWQRQTRRDYSYRGPLFEAIFGYKTKDLHIGLGHQTFIAFADRLQTEAYVAWPFNSFFVHWGLHW